MNVAIFIVLLMIPFGEKPVIMKTYDAAPGIYKKCKEYADDLNNQHGTDRRFDCSLKRKENR